MQHQRPNPETDPFRPPDIPVEVFCLHCRQEFESYLMEWCQEKVNGKFQGFWCCPTPGCDGKGFGMDIYPTDPDYRSADGEPIWDDGEDEEAFDEIDQWLEGEDEAFDLGDDLVIDFNYWADSNHSDDLTHPPIQLDDDEQYLPRRPRGNDEDSN